MPGALSPFPAAEPTVCLELYLCFVGPHHVRETAIRLVQILLHEGQTLHLVLLTNHLAVRTASERPAQGRTAAEDCRRRNVVAVAAEKGVELDGRGLIVALHLAWPCISGVTAEGRPLPGCLSRVPVSWTRRRNFAMPCGVARRPSSARESTIARAVSPRECRTSALRRRYSE